MSIKYKKDYLPTYPSIFTTHKLDKYRKNTLLHIIDTTCHCIGFTNKL